ncbi:hypothetical protein [Dapis sp. BLCC M229]|uniref:hypothetical protein n=1 Tax=Dapis sp. BLCC M229 TaxID=3400188 RepID=UPI003CFA55F0
MIILATLFVKHFDDKCRNLINFRVHLNFEESQKFIAFREQGTGNRKKVFLQR